MYRNEKISFLIDSLNELGLGIMASSLDSLYHSQEFLDLDHLSLLSSMIEPEYEARVSRRLISRLKRAHLNGQPVRMESCIDSSAREYLPTGIKATLSSLAFVQDGLNLCILGPSGSGKSYLAKAIGIEACHQFRVEYHHCESLVESLTALKVRDFPKYQRRMKALARIELLILDDFLLHTIGDEREVKVIHELLELRSETKRSVIVCSQREPKSWTSMILNDEVAANAILKRAAKHYTVVINQKEK